MATDGRKMTTGDGRLTTGDGRLMTGDGKMMTGGRRKATDSVSCDSWFVTRMLWPQRGAKRGRANPLS